MVLKRDTFLELESYGEVPELKGHNHPREYTPLYLVVTEGGRGFLHLSSIDPKDFTKNQYYAYETGMSDIGIAVKESGNTAKDRVQAFKQDYLPNMKIQESRLVPIEGKNPELTETFESTVERLLDLSPAATLAAKTKMVMDAPAPNGLE